MADQLQSSSRLPLAVSMGDPSGIGPDIALQAWSQRHSLHLPRFVMFGDPDFLRRRAALLGIDVTIRAIENCPIVPDDESLPVIPSGTGCKGRPGKPERADATATLAAIEDAADAVFRNRAAALVTCPINKAVLYNARFTHPGHTEFLAELASKHDQRPQRAVMMLAGPQLRTVPVTIHVPLADVPGTLTRELLKETIEITARDLKHRFGIANPRIAVAGLNPHAGEHGEIGLEEKQVIEPVLEALRERGFELTGPLPADTMFHKKVRETYDVAICMYHDQALIPAKMLDFDTAVNVTLGLSLIRTSPDHGTAYDIAGSGKANPSSFIAALRLARQMADNT